MDYVEFRVITQHEDIAVINMKKLLNYYGIKVYDLKESDIVTDTDNRKINEVYLLCCKGSSSVYSQFKQKYNYNEKTHEGIRTLF